MTFAIILIVIGLAVAVASIMGYLPIPWWIGAAIAAGGALLILYEKITGKPFYDSSWDTVDEEVPTTVVDSCGCQSGEQTVLRYKPWAAKARTSFVPCSVALNAVATSKRYSIVGCQTI